MNQFVSIVANANAMITKDPGVIVGPILKVLGFINDAIYNLVYPLTAHNALGLSVILLTIIARTLILPLAFKSQKSMTKMQLLQPEFNKIKAKYGDSAKDPEIQKKMSMEQQALYSKHKVNPLSGCLPLLVTMPIFFALNSLFRETYRYITKIGEIYTNISQTIMAIPGYADAADAFGLRQLIFTKLPSKMSFDPANVADMNKAINVFTPAEWSSLVSKLPADSASAVSALLDKKDAVESFFGLSMVNSAGLGWPGILIPILVALTTVASSLIMMWTNPNQDKQAKTQQIIMMVVMPVMMFMFTISMPSGVGIYWIVSSVYQTVQQYFLNAFYRKRITLEGAGAPALKVIDGKTADSGSKPGGRKK